MEKTSISRLWYVRIRASILGLLWLLALAGVAGSSNQSGREARTYRIRRGDDHPLKFLGIRNLDSDNFPYDLEIDVKNVSPKPIYFFRVNLLFPGVPGPSGGTGAILGFPLYYGRLEMISLGERATPDDPPLEPGETLVLRSSEGYQQGLRIYRSTASIQDSAFNDFTIDFQEVGFGD